jgi:hypothetical protein
MCGVIVAAESTAILKSTGILSGKKGIEKARLRFVVDVDPLGCDAEQQCKARVALSGCFGARHQSVRGSDPLLQLRGVLPVDRNTSSRDGEDQ